MADKKKVIKIIKDIDDPKLKNELLKLYIKRDMLMKQKEKEQMEMHNKYLPKYLSPKILNAVGFIEFTKQKGQLDMPAMTKFLTETKKLTSKEMSWVLLLLSFEAVEEILSTPEVGGMIRDAIQKNRGTIH